jgi:hypothetical protein
VATTASPDVEWAPSHPVRVAPATITMATTTITVTTITTSSPELALHTTALRDGCQAREADGGAPEAAPLTEVPSET